MRGFLHRRLIAPLDSLMRQGASPAGLAMSVALAVTIGLIPVLGVSTLLCALAVLSLRLNMPAMQLVNYLVTPLQLLLIIPQLRLGEHLAGAPPFPVTLESGMALLSAGMVSAVQVLATAILHATLAWLLLAPPLAFLLYHVLHRAFRRLTLSPEVTR